MGAARVLLGLSIGTPGISRKCLISNALTVMEYARTHAGPARRLRTGPASVVDGRGQRPKL